MRVKGYAASVVSLITVWWAFARAVKAPYLPAPVDILREALQGEFTELLYHTAASVCRIIAGLSLGVIAGVPAGLYLGINRIAGRLFTPSLYLLYPIPKIVLLPILLLFLGIGDTSKVALIWLTVFFQIVVAVRDGAANIPAAAIRSVVTLGATKAQIFRHVVLPYCLPTIFSAMRVSVGTSIAVLFFAESFATSEGLGYFVMDSWGKADYPAMYAGVTVMSLLGLSLYLALDAVQFILCPWLRYP